MKFLEANSQNTPNSIFCKQNDELLLQCQLAQRNEYSYAKKIIRTKSILTFGFAVLSVVASIKNVDLLTAVVSLLAVMLLVTNKYVESCSSTHKKHAALIQQYIDATLYSAIINGEKLDWGNMPSNTDIATATSKFKNADTSEVQNWYSDYSSLSPYEQVFHCQRKNVRWDYDLQKKFKLFQIIVTVIIFLITCSAFLAVNPTFVKSICVLSWFVPVAEYYYSIYREVDKNIKLLQSIDKQCDTIETELTKLTSDNYSEIKKLLVELQYKIWNRRETGVLIPDRFYNFFKKKQQETEDNIAIQITTLNRRDTENSEPRN